MRKRLILGGVAALFATSVVLPAVTASAVPEPAADLAWGACPADVPYQHLQCTTITVPLDHSRPTGQTIELAVTRAKAKDPAKRRGVLVLNNGGPGASPLGYVGRLTLPNAAGVTRMPASVLDAYDIVGIDPRGVAHSTPVSCVDPAFWDGPLTDPDDPAERTTQWKLAGEFTDGCQQNAGQYLRTIGTINVARDMDKVRLALGEDKISFLGYSYGTYLGAVYSKLFPQRLDRMILDGNMNPVPQDLYYQAMRDQVPAIYHRRRELFTWIAKHDGVFRLGTTADQVGTAWDSVMADVREAPHGKVGPAEIISLTAGMTYGNVAWTPFAHALSDWVVDGDDTALVDMAAPAPSPASENSTATFVAVQCVDSVWPTDRARWERDAAAIQAQYPLVGWSNAWSSAPCADWPVANDTRVVPDGAGLGPVLVIGNLRDPATPYASSVAMHRLLPTSRLVTVDQGRHCAFAAGGIEVNAAVNDVAADYLVTGKLPAQNISLPGYPDPVPTAATTAVAPDSLVAAVH